MSFEVTGRRTRNQIMKENGGGGNIKLGNENLKKPPLNNIKKATNRVFGLKRKAEDDSFQNKKRPTLGDITNAFEKTLKDKKEVSKGGKNLKLKNIAEPLLKIPSNKTLLKNDDKPSLKIDTKPDSKEILEKKAEESFNDSIVVSSQELQANKINLEESQSYVTASEGSLYSPVIESLKEKLTLKCEEKAIVDDVENYDYEMIDDPFAVACYAKEVFDYYKEREKTFVIDKYISRQPDISKSMRAILVDWMVEVQESFELNHETLYLAVKLVDLYLSRMVIQREKLQLVGSTAVFIACKFDERVPPYIDDFLYICDDAYKRKELVSLEIKMLKTLKYDLGIPLSYRYLRRYARCAKVQMEDLTFARYILEMSLMEYELIDASDSLLAAAALCLALTIKKTSKWTKTLQHYSGFTLDDIYHYVQTLHNMLSQPPKDHLKTIRNKYSHKVFYEVATIPIPETLDL